MCALAIAASLFTPLALFATASDQSPANAKPGVESAGQTGGGGSTADDDHILRPGDLLEVKVFQEPDMDSSLRVAKDGSILFPLIERVSVGGLTPSGAATLIQRLLDKDYLVNPHVALRVIEYAERSYTVLGEVQKPGSFDMPDRASVSLLEAIGMAGGYTRMANPSNVTVKRKVKDQELIYHVNAKKMAASSGPDSTFEIEPDDVITVSESMF